MAKWLASFFFRELIAFNHFNRIGAGRLAQCSCRCWWMSAEQITKKSSNKSQMKRRRNERRERWVLLRSSFLLLLIVRLSRGASEILIKCARITREKSMPARTLWHGRSETMIIKQETTHIVDDYVDVDDDEGNEWKKKLKLSRPQLHVYIFRVYECWLCCTVSIGFIYHKCHVMCVDFCSSLIQASLLLFCVFVWSSFILLPRVSTLFHFGLSANSSHWTQFIFSRFLSLSSFDKYVLWLFALLFNHLKWVKFFRHFSIRFYVGLSLFFSCS